MDFRNVQYDMFKAFDPGTWVNQNSSTFAEDGGGYLLSVPASGSFSISGRFKTAPSTPWSVKALIVPQFAAANATDVIGLAFRQNDGKQHVFGVGYHNAVDGGYYLLSGKANSPTSYSANYSATPFQIFGQHLWLKIEDDGSNRICSWSCDNRKYQVFDTIGRTDFLTATEWGIIAAASNSVSCSSMIYSLEEEG